MKYDKNIYYSLALENYADNTGNQNEDFDKVWNKLAEYRNKRDTMLEEEKNAVQKLGKEKFIIDDGYFSIYFKLIQLKL